MKHVTQLKADTLTTKQMAERYRQVSNDIRRFRDVEASSELAEFKDLQKIVETKEFQDYKQELLTTRYKDREEYRLIRDYNRAKNSHHLRWFKFYRGLQKVQEFEHFSETSDFVKLNDPDAVKADPRLKRMQRLGNSFAVRRYRLHKNSQEVSEYYRLREIVNNKEFRDRNHFWKNPKRWYTTLQSQQDGKYQALKNSSNISFFLAQDPKQIERYESYHEIFADACEWNRMQDSPWQAGFYYGNTKLKTNHSYTNEGAAMNKGRNVSTIDSRLTVEVKAERATAPAWDEKKGFIMTEFDYTGDVIQTAEKFRLDTGFIQVKASFKGKANGAICLMSENRLPILRIAQWDGQKVTVGVTYPQFEELTVVEGLKEGQEYVYSVDITKSDITWYVNNQEVARTANKLGTKVFPTIIEFLPEGVKGTGMTAIDWFKVYKY
ncbi:MAG: hypothetical protein J5688_05875 [Paludibacteraceae bacterium]|nr:hypothetical protein [Paludibacteraceae bacterium]